MVSKYLVKALSTGTDELVLYSRDEDLGLQMSGHTMTDFEENLTCKVMEPLL